jgi:glycosyltransferase involved in cell wall biosynthesis
VPLDVRRAVAPRADLRACAVLARTVGQWRPDVVHAHSSKAGAVARLARAAHPRVPVVYTPHGYAFAGHFERRSEREAYRAAERALAPLASRVVCVCEAEARLARTIGPRGRVRVVHNGIDLPLAGPSDERVARLAARGPAIGALTQLRPGKGLETLIDAVPAMLARHPDAQIAVVGEGPDRERLQARVRARGVSDAVHLLGPSAQPLEALRPLDVFVHPSWAESFPYVVLEAMGLGLPIVASAVGGVQEAIESGASGLLVPARRADALAGAVCELLEDRARAVRMGAAARRRLGARFTRAAMIDGLTGVYDEVVRPLRDTMSVGSCGADLTMSALPNATHGKSAP